MENKPIDYNECRRVVGVALSRGWAALPPKKEPMTHSEYMKIYNKERRDRNESLGLTRNGTPRIRKCPSAQ
jgi:hypothetical protein